MISFILYEDDIFFIEKYKIIIEKVMINYDLDYQVVTYKDKLPQKIEETYKIYIMSDTKITIEKIIKIRKEIDDWQSMIIVTSENNTNRNIYLNNNLLVLDYINKNNNFENTLKEDILITIKSYTQRPNTLKYTYKNNIYSIEYKNIIYIEKEPNSKRCIIRTNENIYYVPKSLKEIETKLDSRFIKCSKSNIINIEKVLQYDNKNNIIYFNNKIKPFGLSRNYKKEVIKKMLGNDRNMSK